MAENWTANELRACVSTYLWMLRAEQDGHTPIKSRVHNALLSGPLSDRSMGAVQYRLRNISHVLDQMSEPWIKGYHPAANVGSKTADEIKALIAWVRSSRARRRQPWLVNALPLEIVQKSADQKAGGCDFIFRDSTDYDVVAAGVPLPPKKIIGFAGQLFYNAPIYPDIQSSGDKQPTFNKLYDAELPPRLKVLESEDSRFRDAVSKANTNQDQLPAGKQKPKQREQTTTAYIRDPAVVAYVERRAGGICELCDEKAPFDRETDGTPFLEVHHIDPLGDDGPDTIENAVGICPNCHRKAHYGVLSGDEVEKMRAAAAQ